MPGYTNHYGLLKLMPGDLGSIDDYAFFTRNLDSVDQKLYSGAEGHHHTGVAGDLPDPTSGLSLSIGSGGYLPAGSTIRYRFTWINALGEETGPSPETTINTPSPVATPMRAIPSLSHTTPGILLPGNYWYKLSAYVDNINQETSAGPNTYITVPAHTSVSPNTITLTMPAVPSGADGWNIYKRSPGTMAYNYLDSIDYTTTTYVDDGTVAMNCNRYAPLHNSTNANCSVIITLPGSTPVVPAGCTWRVYRTLTANDWASSYLEWVVAETSIGSGIIVSSTTDLGTTTQIGSYPTLSQISGSPDQIQLTNSSDVQGTLPPGKNVIPITLNFTQSGPVTASNGEYMWVNEYDNLQIISIRASLGVDSAPSSQDVIADIVRWDSSNSTWDSIFQSPVLSFPCVIVPTGSMIGPRYELSDDGSMVSYPMELNTGDALRVDVIQSGGGATPTDYNLMVTILCLVKYGSESISTIFA